MMLYGNGLVARLWVRLYMVVRVSTKGAATKQNGKEEGYISHYPDDWEGQGCLRMTPLCDPCN